MDRVDRFMLDLAARAALRAAGDVEPNPLVGCVLARPRGGGGATPPDDPGAWTVLSVGHHRRFGGAHAEIDALSRCRALGADPAGAVVFVTLEPCNHTGKTPPCARALIDARVREVVFARADPNPIAAGGADALRAAGLAARVSDASALARALSEPFVHRLRTGRPWVIAKWAQTPGGSLVAPRAGAGTSGAISCPDSLRRVHRLRARVDAVLIGVGTALADDPLLTARGAPRLRRIAQRIVLDSSLRLSPESALATSARTSPVVVVCAEGAPAAFPDRAHALRARAVRILETPPVDGGVDLYAAFARLGADGAHTVLVEPGPTLLRALLRQDLIDEAWAFIAGVAGDQPRAHDAAIALAPALADPARFTRGLSRRSGADALLIWRRSAPA